MSGIQLDLPEAEYHAHPALSYSTGKHYLRSRAHYLAALADREEKSTFDVGHAIHALVLGEGMEIVEVPFDSYRTKAAQEVRDQAYAEGKTPIKTADLEPVQRAADAVLMHPTARKWLERPGAPEVSLFATDPETGVEIRGRVDYLPDASKGRTSPVDLKTTVDARIHKIKRAITDYDYDLQSAIYRHLITLARGDETGPMVQIYAEKAAPYGVQVVQIAHEDWIDGGEIKLRKILERHAYHQANPDAWDGYPLGELIIEPPGYYLMDLDRLDAPE